jgi:hypothetical protein
MEVKERIYEEMDVADNMKNFILESPLPDCVRSEPCWLGIDEAGRGPVLGPMVYGICFSPISLKEKFGQMGFADSKTMTEEQREVIFDKMLEAKDMLGWMVEVLSPTFISTSMLRNKQNLSLFFPNLKKQCQCCWIFQVFGIQPFLSNSFFYKFSTLPIHLSLK